MSLISIRATFDCDECGTRFSVALDESAEVQPGWSLYDEAVDAVRGSIEYDEPHASKLIQAASSSVQDEKCLCAHCTKKADAAYFEAHPEEMP